MQGNPLAKLVDYLHVQADKPLYNYYVSFLAPVTITMITIARFNTSFLWLKKVCYQLLEAKACAWRTGLPQGQYIKL